MFAGLIPLDTHFLGRGTPIPDPSPHFIQPRSLNPKLPIGPRVHSYATPPLSWWCTVKKFIINVNLSIWGTNLFQLNFDNKSWYRLFEIMLLWTDDAARTGNAHPRDRFRSSKLVVLHQIAADKGACPSKTGCEKEKTRKATKNVCVKIWERKRQVAGRYFGKSTIFRL